MPLHLLHVRFDNPVMASEDLPKLKDRDISTVAVNQAPLFFADEGAPEIGVRAMAGMAMH